MKKRRWKGKRQFFSQFLWPMCRPRCTVYENSSRISCGTVSVAEGDLCEASGKVNVSTSRVKRQTCNEYVPFVEHSRREPQQV